MLERFIKLQVIQGYGDINPGLTKIQTGKNGTLKFSQSIWRKPAQYYVEDIHWQHSEDRNVGKVAAGGAIGGLVAGPVGIAVGALIGSRKKDSSTAVIVIDTDQGSANILIKCNAKEFQQLVSLKK